MAIHIGMIDDERLFVESLRTLIDTFESARVVLHAGGARELMQRLQTATEPPDILLVDVNMKELDGVATARLVHEKYPLIRLAALSSNDEDGTILRMIRAGCCAYLLKETITATELELALGEIYRLGYYNGDAVNVNHRRLLTYKEVALTDRERDFVRLSCSDLTYKQIAAQMHLSERTIDGYREQVFVKMQVQSRVGMVLEAIRRGIAIL